MCAAALLPLASLTLRPEAYGSRGGRAGAEHADEAEDLEVELQATRIGPKEAYRPKAL